MVFEIIKIMEKNRGLLNPYYDGITFEVNQDDGCWIFIKTKYKKLPSNKQLEKIKGLFKGIDAMFVEGEPNFWSVRLR